MMKHVAVAGLWLAAMPFALAGEAEECSSFWSRPGLTGDWGGLRTQLEDAGITLELGLTQVLQQNLRGGLRHDDDAREWSGSYDVILGLDLGKALSWSGASILGHVEGGWSSGVDPEAVGSLFGVNADAVGNRNGDLTELYFEQGFLDNRVILRAGKINMTCGFECHGSPVAFDKNRYAHDESAQFLNGALKANPTVPFPDNGPGVAAYVQPLNRWYVAAAVADADANGTTSGLQTGFHGPSNLFLIAETGVTPVLRCNGRELQGAYRVGAWMNRGRRDRLDGTGTKTDPKGFYISADQQIWRENDEDEQGVGLFGRYGLADAAVSEVKAFWSGGVSGCGLIPGRDEDVAACGVAQGRLNRKAHTASNETGVEMYYNAMLTPWMRLTGDAQYIVNPGGERAAKNAIVAGLRLQLDF